MFDLRVAAVPVGKIDAAEVEAVAARVSKILNRPIELRAPAAVPRASEDAARGQHRADVFLVELRRELARLAVAKLVGGAAPPGPSTLVPTPNPDAVIFLTDVDLFKPDTEGVFGDLDSRNRCAVLSVRRMREAFYRRKADPAKQRARIVKVMLQAIGRFRVVADCRDSRCVMAPTGALADVDLKEERFCGNCSKRLTTGVTRI
jgi:predicted Zn-dependent protease